MAIFLFALSADVILQLLDPDFAFFPVQEISNEKEKLQLDGHLLRRIKHIAKHHAATCHIDIDGQWLGLSLRSKNLLLIIDSRLGSIICSCKLPHQCVPTEIVEVHTRNICIIQGTSPGSFLGFTATSSTVEVVGASGFDSTTALAGKEGTLEIWLARTMAMRAMRLGGELIVAKANADCSTCKIKSIHLLQRFSGLVRITEP